VNHWYTQNQLKTSLQATPAESGTLCQIFCHSRMQLSHIWIHFRLPKNAYLTEMAGVTFSDSDPAPFPKFFNPGPDPVRQYFKFENPTRVQTPTTIVNPTLIQPYFYLRNDHTDSCYCRNWERTMVPVSSKISDLCEISVLLLFASYYASQNKEIKFGKYFFDVCCVNSNFLVRCQAPTRSYSTGIASTTENFRI